ncbi:hypothetical protein V8F20_003723 [Naviculisporaceae sp. PSN 640]
MSAPPHRHGASTPHHQRTQSQNNSLGIRIVPYTPPKIDDAEGRVPSQASTRTETTTTSVGARAGRDSGLGVGNYEDLTSRRPSWIGADDKEEDYASSNPSSALTSSSVTSLLLAKAKDEGVSVSKLSSYPSAPLGTRDPFQPIAPGLRSPSEVSSNITAINASTLQQPITSPSNSRFGGPPSPASPASTISHPRPLSRRRNLITINPDNKTFSIVRLGADSGSQSADVPGGIVSPALSTPYSSRTTSTQDRPSIDAWSDARPSSPTGTNATIPDSSLTEIAVPSTPSPGPYPKQLAEDHTTSSPWNYRMVGGLRKVAKTPDLKGKDSATTLTQETAVLAPLPQITVLREEEEEEQQDTRTVVPKTSFASIDSAQTFSTTSETTNYKVYGPASSPQPSEDSLPLLPSSSANYVILGETSSPAPISSTPPAVSDRDSEENYVLHGDPSPSPSSSAVVVPTRQPRPTYSQESLVVPPLRPARKKSYEGLGYYKQRSRESLRARAGSLQSLKTISSIATTQDATQVFAAPAPGSSTGFSTTPSATAQQQRPVQMIQAHPHQWSSQLSTVMSESEESERSPSVPSRSASPSISGGNSHRRRSSLGWGSSSLHSRQLQSISSSLAAQLEEGAATTSGSGTESLDRPQPTLSRSTPSQRMIRDQDEHGDGIADLADQPSRSGLSGYFMSSNNSSRNLHSSASSRSNSFTSASIPAWARVYYGSGERKFLGAPSIAGSDVGSAYNGRPGSTGLYSTHSNSPNPDNYPMAIYSQRKRAREVHPHPSQRPFSDSASMDIAPVPQNMDYNVFRSIKRKTSSIWSPHLRQDRRASRYSVWDPPSISWSADSGILGKRNAQVIAFTLGFIFPFAWMIGALLPLPPNPKFEMLERGDNDFSTTSRSKRPEMFSRSAMPKQRIVDETRFESARWWRNLNRIMSVVGLLIIGAVVALAVVGVREHWVVSDDA